MFYNYIMLALCLSIDSLGTGIKYDLKNTRISNCAKLILFIFSLSITSFSLLVGNAISSFFSNFSCNLVGGIILCIMGLWIIFQGPEHSDLDNSNNIDAKESMFLAIALSLDSIGVSIGGSIIGITSIWFPILVSLFQLAFLSTGSFLGNKIKNTPNIPDIVWNIISGVVLVLIGISKFF